MYVEYRPPKECSYFLENIWYSEDAKPGSRIFPDNNTDIIIPLNDCSPVKFAGYMTKYLSHNPPPGQKLLGIRFKPGFAAAYIKDDMHLVSDQVVELSSIRSHGFDDVREKFLEDGSFAYEHITELLYPSFEEYRLKPEIAKAISIIGSTCGNIRIEEVSQLTGTSRRMLERRFKQFLGKTPKRFAQIERFNSLINDRKMLLTADYHDQSHMIKEFKLLTGMTPSHFFS